MMVAMEEIARTTMDPILGPLLQDDVIPWLLLDEQIGLRVHGSDDEGWPRWPTPHLTNHHPLPYQLNQQHPW